MHASTASSRTTHGRKRLESGVSTKLSVLTWATATTQSARDSFVALLGTRLAKSKHARVLAMLRRTEGASGPQIAEAMGWAPHTVRGFLAGLAKKGVHSEVLDRIRQIGLSK
jgi:DNA-binding MarR family transcriptional regulator